MSWFFCSPCFQKSRYTAGGTQVTSSPKGHEKEFELAGSRVQIKFMSWEIKTRLGIFRDYTCTGKILSNTWSVRCTYLKQTQCVVLVLACFTDCTKRDAIGMAVVVSFKNQNSGYRGKFQWNCDKGKRNLVRISEEFELSE